jgi:Spy/CpxP family protein refolding chaperone
MRFKKLLAMLAATLFAATAVACASMPESDDTSSSRSEREVPNGYF